MKKFLICLFFIVGCAHMTENQKYAIDVGTSAIAQQIWEDSLAYAEYCQKDVAPENIKPCIEVEKEIKDLCKKIDMKVLRSTIEDPKAADAIDKVCLFFSQIK